MANTMPVLPKNLLFQRSLQDLSEVPSDQVLARVKTPKGKVKVTCNGTYLKEKESYRRISDALGVCAVTIGPRGLEVGRLCRFKSVTKTWVETVLPDAVVHQRARLIERLTQAGFLLPSAVNDRDVIVQSIACAKPTQLVELVSRSGWHEVKGRLGDGLQAFVLGSHVFQPEDIERPIKSSLEDDGTLGTAGTVEDWTKWVGGMCPGNPRLTFSVCLAFGAPLKIFVGGESGLILWCGPSTLGKTAVLEATASVYGDPSMGQATFNMTKAGYEGLAARYNDLTVTIDEISQIDSAEDLSQIIYTGGNGVGGTRANPDLSVRTVAVFRTDTISAGEESMLEVMDRLRKKPKSGEELRMLSIPVRPPAGMFRDLHQLESTAAFAEELKRRARLYHGSVGREYLKSLVRDYAQLRQDIPKRVKEVEALIHAAVRKYHPDRLELRAIKRFARTALAGELATELKVTGLESGWSTEAAKVCCRAWLKARHQAAAEEHDRLVEHVRGHLITSDKASKFPSYRLYDPDKPRRSIGYRHALEGRKVLLLHPVRFKQEICKGNELNLCIRALKGKLLLIADDRNTRQVRVPGKSNVRPSWYVVLRSILKAS